MRTRTSRFFLDHDLAVDRDISLPTRTSHHIKNVLRLGEGDPVIVFNGEGGEYCADITAMDRHHVHLHIVSHDSVERESPLTTELGLAVIKRDAMDLAIRKSTELGVTRIVPLLTDFTTVPRKQAEKRFPHWREIIYSACEQCGRNRPPELSPIASLADWVNVVDASMRLVADPFSGTTSGSLGDTPTSVAVLTGPEGGFADEEMALAKRRGFLALSLGRRILRANTAPLVMLTMIQHKWGDL